MKRSLTIKGAIRAFADDTGPKMQALTANVEKAVWGVRLAEAELEVNMEAIKVALTADKNDVAAELLVDRKELRAVWLSQSLMLSSLMEQFGVLMREEMTAV